MDRFILTYEKVKIQKGFECAWKSNHKFLPRLIDVEERWVYGIHDNQIYCSRLDDEGSWEGLTIAQSWTIEKMPFTIEELKKKLNFRQ